jgi:ABC-2 type transport system permease protein
VRPLAGAAPGLLDAAGDLAKFPAFLRRDVLVALSYRVSFFSDIVGLVFMVVVFFYVGKMLDPAQLPTYNGVRVSYMEFVFIGIVLGAFLQIGLGRVMTVLRQEQLMGTLESLLMTPTSPTTIQLGSAAYDLIYVPIRTAAVLIVGTIAFGLDLHPVGILPAVAVLLLFIPFVWGLGIACAGAILTVKRGAGGLTLIATFLTLTSGAFFPLTLFPGWAAAVAMYNPMAVTTEAMREALLGGAGWAQVAPDLLLLVPMSAASLTAGMWLFRIALRREQRAGTLGLY